MPRPSLVALCGALSILAVAIFADGAGNAMLTAASTTVDVPRTWSETNPGNAAPPPTSSNRLDALRPETGILRAGQRKPADAAVTSSTNAPCKRPVSAWEQGMTKWASNTATSATGVDAQQNGANLPTGGAFRSDLEIESAILDNGTISLSYFMPESGTPQFEMFDVLGQRLVSRRIGLQIPGVHTAEFPAPDRARGTCFVQLRVGTKTSVKLTVRMGE